MQKISLSNQHFLLHPSGAAIWEKHNILLLSDVHLGKSAHFRKNGMAVPSSADDREFDKLIELVAELSPAELWILGDLFHSEANTEWHFFEQWMASVQIPVTLIVGNHDIIDQKRYAYLGVRLANDIKTSGLWFTHHPQTSEEFFNIAGHIHPAIRMQGVGRQRLRVACFFIREKQMILPAFGDFTGTHVLRPRKSDQIFALAEGEVICVSKGE
jgi:DNA ligase-associated metallophosphoesterase